MAGTRDPGAGHCARRSIVGEGAGQGEAGEGGVVEPGDRADPVAGQGDDEQAGGAGWSADGSSRAKVTRARLSALVTDCSVLPSRPATSRAEKSRTSRRMRAARWRGGSNWSAVTKASEMASRAS